MEIEIKTPYLFIVQAPLGDVLIKLPVTEWHIAKDVEMRGSGIAVRMLREDMQSAIGMYGTLVNIDRATPMGISAALADLSQRKLIISFSIIGYVPKESPAQVGDDGETREEERDDDGIKE